ncbi:MAG: PHP domain-containing protein [Candidatus Aminicenantes bacterium]
MFRTFKADLHIHTCLSPCTELDMSPKKIVAVAKEKEIDIVGICDHNSSENSLATIKAAKKMNIHILPGMEVTSQEEVHVLGLFEEIEEVLKLQDYVYENLPGENDEEVFGMQVMLNEKDEVLGFNKKLLIGATTIPLEEIIGVIHSFNGIAIASHIDRESFSVVGQLGFIPDNLELDALEISPYITLEEAKKRFNNKYPFTSFSDAHYPDDIGKVFTYFLLKRGTVSEIKKALKNEDGRKLIH